MQPLLVGKRKPNTLKRVKPKKKKKKSATKKKKKKREELPSPLTELCYPRLLVLFKKPTAFESTLGLFNSRRSNDVNQAVGPNPLMQLSLCIISIPALEAGMIFILASFSSSSLCLSLLKPWVWTINTEDPFFYFPWDILSGQFLVMSY